MHLLLVNDDGIHSPLLRVLMGEALRRGHQVTISAPATQQSAKSHAFTVFDPVLVDEVALPCPAYAVHGTPVDCTRLGLLCLAEKPVDMVISGINLGYNAGMATYVSGTVGAAREAAFLQGRAIAVSVHPAAPEEAIACAARMAVRLAEAAAQAELPPQCVLNLNLPPHPPEERRASRLCALNRSIYRDGYEARISHRGQRYYWLEPESAIPDPTPGSDQALLNAGHPTLSVITVDGCVITHELEQLLQSIEG